MQVTGMLQGAKLLQFVGFPTSEVLGPDASEDDIKAAALASEKVKEHLNGGTPKQVIVIKGRLVNIVV